MLNPIYLCIFRAFPCVHQAFPSRLMIISSLSTWNKVELKIKELSNSKKYAEVLDFYHQQCKSSSALCSTIALKAAIKLGDYQSGVRIHEKLSTELLENHFVQTSLLHLYSRFEIDIINSLFQHDLFLVQIGDVNRAQKIFSTIEKKTVHMYGVMLKGNRPSLMKRN